MERRRLAGLFAPPTPLSAAMRDDELGSAGVSPASSAPLPPPPRLRRVGPDPSSSVFALEQRHSLFPGRNDEPQPRVNSTLHGRGGSVPLVCVPPTSAPI